MRDGERRETESSIGKMPVNGDTSSSMAAASGDKLTSLSLTSGAAGGDTPDFGEAFQPHVDTKQIQVPPESSPGETSKLFDAGFTWDWD